MSLYCDRRLPHPQVFFAGQPAADSLLDADTCHTQLIRTQLLQVSHLTSPEEDLVLAKLILILVLRAKKKIYSTIYLHTYTINNYKYFFN